jgi:guanylate kinase
VSPEEFERLRAAGGFLESFEVFGDLRGTPKQFILDELAAGRDVMLEVDVQGALAVRRIVPEALLVFLQAPSRDVQRQRLEARGSETPESLARRLDRAPAEEELGRTEFDAVVVNHEVSQAADEVAAILNTRRAARS